MTVSNLQNNIVDLLSKSEQSDLIITEFKKESENKIVNLEQMTKELIEEIKTEIVWPF